MHFFLQIRQNSRGGGGWIQTLNRSPGYDLGGGISMGHTRFINGGFSLRTKMAQYNSQKHLSMVFVSSASIGNNKKRVLPPKPKILLKRVVGRCYRGSENIKRISILSLQTDRIRVQDSQTKIEALAQVFAKFSSFINRSKGVPNFLHCT